MNLVNHKAILLADFSAHHPTEDRFVKKGDILQIAHVGNNGTNNFYGWEVDPKFGKRTNLFGNNTQAALVECFSVADFLRQDVEIIANSQKTNHPSEDRYLRIGEIVSVNAEDCDRISFLRNNGKTQYLLKSEVKIVPKKKATGECKCETLIFGHHMGCPYYKG